jgi:hypothetical protein
VVAGHLIAEYGSSIHCRLWGETVLHSAFITIKLLGRLEQFKAHSDRKTIATSLTAAQIDESG